MTRTVKQPWQRSNWRPIIGPYDMLEAYDEDDNYLGEYSQKDVPLDYKLEQVDRVINDDWENAQEEYIWRKKAPR